MLIFTPKIFAKSKIESISMSEPYGTAVWSWDSSKFSKKEMKYILYLNPYTIPPNETLFGPIIQTSKTGYCCNTNKSEKELVDLTRRLAEYKKMRHPMLIELVEERCEAIEIHNEVISTLIRFCKTGDQNVLLITKYNSKNDKELKSIIDTIKNAPDKNERLRIAGHDWRNKANRLSRKHALTEEEKYEYWKKFESKYLKKREIHEIDTF